MKGRKGRIHVALRSRGQRRHVSLVFWIHVIGQHGEQQQVAGKDAQDLDWPKIRQVVKERKGYPIPIATRATADIKKAEK